MRDYLHLVLSDEKCEQVGPVWDDQSRAELGLEVAA